MSKPATREEVYATVAAVLVKDGVLEEKGAVGQAKAKVFGGSKYEAHPERIQDETLSKVMGALEKLDKQNLLKNAKELGLDNLMHGGGKEDLARAAENIGKVASGPGVAQRMQQHVAEAAKPALNVVEDTRREYTAERARAVEQAEHRASQGSGGPRGQMMAEAEKRATSGQGCVREEPSHGLPPSANGPRRGAAGCSR